MNGSSGSLKSFIALLFLSTLCLILISAVPSHSSSIDEVNEAIRLKGARWVARETPLSNLSLEEVRRRLGAPEEAGPPPETILPEPLARPLDLPGGYPSSFDWGHHGGNYVTSIKEQGSCGSCWAFSSTAVLESKALMTFNIPGVDLDLSEQIVLSCTGGQDKNNCEKGGSLADAANFLRDHGTYREGCYPYTATDGNCSQACPDWQSYPYRISNWWFVPGDLSSIKNGLQTSGPLVAWMKVFEDFRHYGSGIYSHVSGDFTGNHFVVIVGWDDAKTAFRVKNSWGTDWGESGFVWMAYSELYGTGATEFGKWVYAFGTVLHQGPAIGPDLVGEWLGCSETCKTTSKGQKCKLTGSFQIQNVGSQDATSFYVDFYLSGDTLLRRLNVPKLAVGASKTVKLKSNLPAGVSGSGEQVVAVIDAGDSAVESNENNNLEGYGPIP